jgi:hypothetical protein
MSETSNATPKPNGHLISVKKPQRTRVIKAKILCVNVISTSSTSNMAKGFDLEGDSRAEKGGCDADEGNKQESK